MKQDGQISVPVQGMNRDAHISRLKNTEVSFALNSNTENETGGQTTHKNEPSNYLSVVFPEGYKVVSYKKHLPSNKTYYWLTNPTTKKSSIGYVESELRDRYNEDEYQDCDDCKEKLTVGEPLENVIQEADSIYTELINDICHPIGKGLNFDINFPLKFIHIKTEKGSTTAYWNDYRNPPRWMELSDVGYLFQQEIPCDNDIVEECFIVEKLLQFPNHSKIKIVADQEQIGGNLKFGTYEFYAAYCDAVGNNVANYSVPTNPVSIFDENNNILSQTELDTFTNFAIRLKMENLDKRFKYYKIVCVERSSVDKSQSVFLEGIHPTTDDTVLYTSSGSSNDSIYLQNGNVSLKKRMDLQELFQVRPTYDKAVGTMSSGGRQYMWGLYKRPEVNLQPVVNLFGALMKWQSSAAKESLYKSPVATSKYKGWRRNEVQPYALRFFYKDGDYTSTFPIVARPSIGTEKDVVDLESNNYLSLSINTPSCGDNDRDQNWQIFNTATQDGVHNDYTENSTEVQEMVSRTCRIEDVATIPTNTINIQLQTNYTNLKDYIEDNYTEVTEPSSEFYIPEIAPYLSDPYPLNHCDPNFQGDCPIIELTSQRNEIATVVNEQTVFVQKCMEEYLKAVPPAYCGMYKVDPTVGGNLRDTEFEEDFMPCSGSGPSLSTLVYKREGTFLNEECGYATDVPNNTSPQQSGQAHFNNYKGADTLAELLTPKDILYTSSYFQNKLHKGALYFRVKRNGRDKLIFEVTKNIECDTEDDIPVVNQMRYTFYQNCSTATPLAITPILPCGETPPTLGLIDTTQGILIELDVSTYPEIFYVALDSPLVSVAVPINRSTTVGGFPSCSGEVTKYRTAPACGCYSVYTRDEEYTSANITWDNIFIDKMETYTSECSFFIPNVDDCNPIPYAYGKFSYWESIREYPDNAELYDSSNLNITQSDLALLSLEDKLDFETYFTEGYGSKYLLKADTNLRCARIRHPKFPDNDISPFMSDINSAPFAEALIFPLGVMLDSNVVKTMLIIALNNGLITQTEFDNIEGYEILKGDNSVHKSVIANGLGYDMYSYEKSDNQYLYANYPHNDLGSDIMHYSNESRSEFIQHPHGSSQNNRFSFLSPDLLLTRPSIPTEMVISGYQTGNSNMMFVDVDDHPEWTILGSDARATATILATAEALLEIAIKVTEFVTQSGAGNFWFVAGLANGTNAVGAGISWGAIAVYGIATFAGQAMKLGGYRYEWLKIFRDLGSSYNFANYQVSYGHHNNFLKNTQTADYIRGLSAKKYLKKGRYTIRDKNGDKLYVNNFLREDSTFLSTGDYFFDYLPDYQTHDNSNLSPEQGSRTILSQNNCLKDVEHQRNVGSPYITLKNYIPDQFGDIDSVKWLTTNETFEIDEFTTNRTIFGGNVSLSRFTWKRKLPFFTKDIVGGADKIPFNYYDYKNVGYPRFYCNYEEDTRYDGFLIPFPDIDSNYIFDCENGSRGFYVKPPSKMYLYSYGITDFLVESEINCNFRYGGKALKDQFYPQVGDIVEWTQQKNVSITEPNTFFYNNIYSLPVTNTPYRFLDGTYSKELWEMRNKQDNAVIMSEDDNSENSITDPWLIFKPLNWYEFKKDKGRLILLKDLENGEILASFEDGQTLFNVVDSLADRITPQTKNLGIGQIFGTRPLEFKMTDLGFAGTQHSEMVSTPYGHFKVDAKRGKVFNVAQNGKDLQIISEAVGNQPSGLKNWFKENIPFNLLKDYPQADIDNKYKGIGISMGWDERFGRLFITKKDYKVINKECLKYKTELGFYTDCGEVAECEEGLDLVFVLDATGSQQDSIDNIINGIITDILPAVITEFGVNYRFGLVAVKDRRFTESSLFDILTPMSIGNIEEFTIDINSIVATGGNGLPEPTDKALEAVLNNTQEINFLGDIRPSDTMGTFRTNAAKAVILVTDNTPSGLNDAYSYEDWTNADSIASQYNAAGIQIFSFLTTQTQPAPIAPNEVDLIKPNVTYIMQNYASVTGGSYTFSPLGVGLSNDIVSIIESGIACEGAEEIPIDFDNTNYFKDVSWTISYKPTEQSWQSYWTFNPDFYVSHTDFFQIGHNYGIDKEKLWSHYLGNQSFQVFQGRKEPWIVELPLINENVQKMLSTVYIQVEAKRYNDRWNYSQNDKVGFNKMAIFNNTNHSGTLHLNLQKSLRDVRDYPKTNPDKSQGILYSSQEGKHIVNYFYNRVKDQYSNIPLELWDYNMVRKTVNPDAISFYGKKPLEVMRGEQFIIRLEQDEESRYGMELKSVQTKVINYQ